LGESRHTAIFKREAAAYGSRLKAGTTMINAAKINTAGKSPDTTHPDPKAG
jgi:hypothetical protein